MVGSFREHTVVETRRPYDDGAVVEGRTNSILIRYLGWDILQLSGAVLAHDSYPQDTTISFTMPTMLRPDPWQGEIEAVVIGSEVLPLGEPENAVWAYPLTLKIAMGSELELSDYYRHRKDRPRTKHTSLYLLGFGDESRHSRFVERQKEIEIGDGVTIDTHAQTIEITGGATLRPPFAALSILTILSTKGGYVSAADLADSCNVNPKNVKPYVQRARSYIGTHFPPGYAIENAHGVGYRLQVPDGA